MSLWLKQSTARTIHIGPFVDDTDGKTAETGLTISQADVRLSKNGGDMAQKNDATSCTHDELGYYTCPLDTTDTNTLGHLKLMVHESGALPVFMDMMVVPANVWDSMFGSDKLDVNTVEIEGSDATNQIRDAVVDDATRIDASALNTLSGHDPGEAIMGATDLGTGSGFTAIPWNAAWDAEVQSECTDALNAYDPPTKAEVDTACGAVTLANGAHGGAAATITLGGVGGLTGAITGNLSGSVGSVTGNVGGNVVGSVGSVAANGMTAASIAADAVAEIQSGLATSAEIAAVKGDTAAILADTGTDGVVVAAASKTGYALTAAYDPAKTAAQASTALSNATWTDVRAGKLDNLDAAISTRLATAGYTAPPTAAANADAVWDELVAEHAGAGSAGATLAAASAPSAAVVADAVWDEALAGHAGAGSAGSALSAAGSAGDPWSTLIPGAYGAGTAGRKIGDLVADQADGGRTDLLIDAIKAKTDTIGSLSVTITSPVATDGTVTIEQGDSYDVAGAAIVATIAKADLAYSLTGATIKLKTQQATITGAVSDDATNWYLTFSPTATQTAALTVVTSAYEIEAMLADSKIKTVQRGTLRVNRDIPAVS